MPDILIIYQLKRTVEKINNKRGLHAVRLQLVYHYFIQDGHNVGIVVHRTLNLVKELGLARIHCHHSILAFLQCHDEVSGGTYLSYRKANINPRSRERFEAGKIASRNISRAFDKMTR